MKTPRSMCCAVTMAALVLAGMLLAVTIISAQTTSPNPPAAPAAMPAKATPAQQEGFSVIGITIRTSMAGAGDAIPGMWQRFMEEQLLSTIPNRVGDDIYVVYTEFDHDGNYTYLLGAKVSSTDKVPAGMAAKQVPAGKYVVVTSQTGALPEVVPAVWQKIWKMTPEELGGQRAFKADYETYNVNGMDPQNGHVDVHIGVQ